MLHRLGTGDTVQVVWRSSTRPTTSGSTPPQAHPRKRLALTPATERPAPMTVEGPRDPPGHGSIGAVAAQAQGCASSESTAMRSASSGVRCTRVGTGTRTHLRQPADEMLHTATNSIHRPVDDRHCGFPGCPRRAWQPRGWSARAGHARIATFGSIDPRDAEAEPRGTHPLARPVVSSNAVRSGPPALNDLASHSDFVSPCPCKSNTCSIEWSRRLPRSCQRQIGDPDEQSAGCGVPGGA